MKKSNTYAKINLDNLLFNFELIKKLHPEKKIISIVKADAYGHGAVTCSKCLQEYGTDYFAVSSIDEAIELREAKISLPIMILGYIDEHRICEVFEYNIIPTVYSTSFANLLCDYASKLNTTIDVNIKIDTGMNRLGFKTNAQTLSKIININESMPNINIFGIFTHYATADEQNLEFAKSQHEKFTKIVCELANNNIRPELIHISNSAAILGLENDISNAIRPGIIQYGINPCEDTRKEEYSFKPVMSFHTNVANIYTVKKGESISYARKYIAQKDHKIAVISCGYADGYSRTLSQKSEVFINGARARICGNICMDMMMVDISNIENVKIGDEVELFGENISAQEIATLIGTIAYEVCCTLNKRVNRMYLKNERIYCK